MVLLISNRNAVFLADACIRCFGTRRVTGEMMRGSSAFAIFAAVAQANAEPANPLGKVLDLMDELHRGDSDGRRQQVYKEHFEWCMTHPKSDLKSTAKAKEKLSHLLQIAVNPISKIWLAQLQR